MFGILNLLGLPSRPFQLQRHRIQGIMAAAKASSQATPLLVPWDRDPAIIGALAAQSPSAFVEPVSLQRANTVRECLSKEMQTHHAETCSKRMLHRHRHTRKLTALQWKDTAQLQARAYLRHVAKTRKAAGLRAEWLAHKSKGAAHTRNPPAAALKSDLLQENSSGFRAPCAKE